MPPKSQSQNSLNFFSEVLLPSRRGLEALDQGGGDISGQTTPNKNLFGECPRVTPSRIPVTLVGRIRPRIGGDINFPLFNAYLRDGVGGGRSPPHPTTGGQ